VPDSGRASSCQTCRKTQPVCLVQVKPAPLPVEKKYGPAAKEARRKEKEERERHRVLEKQKAEEEARQAKPLVYLPCAVVIALDLRSVPA
jgi:hypothetical protein